MGILFDACTAKREQTQWHEPAWGAWQRPHSSRGAFCPGGPGEEQPCSSQPTRGDCLRGQSEGLGVASRKRHRKQPGRVTPKRELLFFTYEGGCLSAVLVPHSSPSSLVCCFSGGRLSHLNTSLFSISLTLRYFFSRDGGCAMLNVVLAAVSQVLAETFPSKSPIQLPPRHANCSLKY